MVKACVVLSGCGHLDGAEIRESVLTLLYLDQHVVQVDIFAANVEQMHVMNHLSQETSDTHSRNVLEESSRIARGKIQDLSKASADDYDALFIPGGFGVAKNLSDFALKGEDCIVNEELNALIHGFYEQQKPIGAVCIAPAILAASLKGKSLTMTIGDDENVAGAIERLGHTHQAAATTEAVIDEANKIATCSAYMREDRIAEVAQGIEKVVQAVLNMIKN